MRLLVGMRGGEHHAFAHAELHLARREVGHHHGELAHQVVRCEGRRDAAEDVAGSDAPASAPSPTSSVRRSSFVEPSTRSASTIFAMRRSTLAKSSMLIPAANARRPAARQARPALEQGIEKRRVDALNQVAVLADRWAPSERAASANTKGSTRRKASTCAASAGSTASGRSSAGERPRCRRCTRRAAGRPGRPARELPGLVLVDVFVDPVGEQHHLAQRLAELALLVHLRSHARWWARRASSSVRPSTPRSPDR